MKFTAINIDWTIEFETDSRTEIDKYIKHHPNIFQVIYRKTDNGPDHLYYEGTNI